MEAQFTRILMDWNRRKNTREMPWKGEKDPYRIWLSEIILQQTRVEQGWNYYNNFISKYPGIAKLAAAPDQEVFKLWEGLGYYNRCRNLLFTARQIQKERKGSFPDTYEDILALKGVGPYTAAAISSFAFNLPHAVVDGNVFRVLARFYGVSEPIDTTRGKQVFTELAEQALDKKRPGLYNQAIMDFGAVVCKPVAPACRICPLQPHCRAYAEGTVNQLPVKEKNLQRKTRWFYYFLFEVKGKVCVHQRAAKDIWQGLFEFYLFEAPEQLRWDEQAVHNWLEEQMGIPGGGTVKIAPVSVQQLTHQQIKGQFIRVSLQQRPAFLKKYQWQPVPALRELPFPKFITQHLEGGDS
jgi:A/G-specific adenine glycosylase